MYVDIFICMCVWEREKGKVYLWPHGVWPTRLLCPWDSLGKNTRVGSHSLLQGFFPTQGLNTSPAFQAISLPSEPLEKPLCVCIYTFIFVWKQENSRKTSISALLTMPKPLTVWITINCGKFWKRWEYQTTWSASWEICMQVRKQQLEPDMEQQTGSK